MYSYCYVNFTNIMRFLELSRSYNTNEEYFKNSEGEVHKVVAEYVPNDLRNMFNFTINNVKMGGEYPDLGDSYEFIKSMVDGR